MIHLMAGRALNVQSTTTLQGREWEFIANLKAVEQILVLSAGAGQFQQLGPRPRKLHVSYFSLKHCIQAHSRRVSVCTTPPCGAKVDDGQRAAGAGCAASGTT